MKLQDNLRQIQKRISELKRKAEWIEAQIKPVSEVIETVIQVTEPQVEQPRRRGRKKLNETE